MNVCEKKRGRRGKGAEWVFLRVSKKRSIFVVYLYDMTVLRMKRILTALCLALMLGACGESDEKKAATLMAQIELLHSQKQYKVALDSIKSLREKYPHAVESRKKALAIWQDASLKIVQADIATTDSALQSVLGEIRKMDTPVIPTRLRIRRDSLQIRYDVLCATVRAIHKRQKE